jgi:hypothetical protein
VLWVNGGCRTPASTWIGMRQLPRDRAVVTSPTHQVEATEAALTRHTTASAHRSRSCHSSPGQIRPHDPDQDSDMKTIKRRSRCAHRHPPAG